MAKALMVSKGFTLNKALIAIILNIILSGITYWQTQNFEVTTTVCVGVFVTILTMALKYADTAEPTPTPTPAPTA